MTDTSPFEAACRAACVQDGRDPDEIVRLSGTYNNLVNPMPLMLPAEYGQLCWKAYEHEVLRLHAILEGLSEWRRKRIDDEIADGAEEKQIAATARQSERDRIIAVIRARQDEYVRKLGAQDVPGTSSAQHATVARELLHILDLIDLPVAIEDLGGVA